MSAGANWDRWPSVPHGPRGESVMIPGAGPAHGGVKVAFRTAPSLSLVDERSVLDDPPYLNLQRWSRAGTPRVHVVERAADALEARERPGNFLGLVGEEAVVKNQLKRMALLRGCREVIFAASDLTARRKRLATSTTLLRGSRNPG